VNRHTVSAAVVVLALGLLVVFGGTDRPSPAPAASVALPRADAESALTSSWFCPSAQGAANNDLTTAIDVANTSASSRSGTVTWLAAGDGKATKQAFSVGPGAVTRLRAAATGPTPVASALVDTVGGGVVVEQVVAGARGMAIAPCSSDGSGEWYLANGTTLVDATEVFTLFNPYPGDAVVDIEFATGKGRVAPGGVQGYVVPAGTTRFVDVTTTVRREEVTAAAVRARTGRLVVSRLQTFDGTQGRTGVSLTLAARAAAEQWAFADGVSAAAWTTQWQVFNPGTREAQVSIEVVPASGDTPEPVEVTVPPRAQVVVPAARDGGVAPGIPFASVVRSSNGVPIVVELSEDVRAPNPHRGWSSALGTAAPADRWAFAYGDTSGSGDEWLTVFNPGAQARRFVASSLGTGGRAPIPTMQGVVVRPAGRVLLRLADHVQANALGLDVEADGPIVIERTVFGVGRPGISVVPGIAVPGR
jgi:hypothetical protein